MIEKIRFGYQNLNDIKKKQEKEKDDRKKSYLGREKRRGKE